MKKLLSLSVLIMLASVAFAQEINPTTPNLDFASFTWDASVFDFGKIKQGVPVTHEFKFTNSGKIPLIITNVQASCGCTTPSWTREPVMPGGEGFIKATYNAAAVGAFNKTVTVTANIQPGFASLTIKGEVEGQPVSMPNK